MKLCKFIIFTILISLLSNMVRADTFEKLIMPGKVIQGHSKYENNCNKCHDTSDKDKQTVLCLDCHDLVDKDIKKKQGFHGRDKSARSKNCKSCHVEHVGRGADIVKLDERIFPHNYTDFKLKGAHKKIRCNSCHKKDKKHREAPKQCYTCHKKNPHKEKLGKECSKCHNEQSWLDISFDHKKTKFKLTGGHKKISCNSCHINNKYKDTPKTCVSCHSVDDVHGGKNGNQCSKCHGTDSWKKSLFDHDRKTKFKLKGRHKKITCNACHVKNPYKVKIKKTCVSCHKEDDEHYGKYGDKCQNCHGVSKWKDIHFLHDKDTKYKLTGRHKKAKCVACHKGYMYKDKTSTQCLSCHKLDDAHKGQINKNCSQCHNTKDWHSKVIFEHDLSGFPLSGLHAITACDDCHATKSYKDAPKKCHKCHVKEDVHKGRLGNKCEDCHTPNDWRLWRFDHDKDTGFKLNGAHKDIHCYECHKDKLDQIESDQSCAVCHADDDPHNNQFGQMCGQCHDSKSFSHIKMKY